MAEIHLLPTAPQIRSIIDYLQELPRSVFHKGSDLAKDGAVQRLWWQRQDKILSAKVQGGYLYTQCIQFKAKSIGLSECTCPQFTDCKHIAAALITYSNGWRGKGADLHGTDDDYDDDDDDGDGFVHEDDADMEDGDEGAHEAPVPWAAIAKIPPSTPPPQKKPAPKKPAALPYHRQNTLAEALATRFGRKLTAAEQKRTALIDEIYQKNTPKASVDLLMAIAGQPKSYRHFYDPPVTLWPNHRPPATVLEAWLYTGYALRKKYAFVNAGPLFSGIPDAEIDSLIAPWLREEAVLHWQKQLTHFNEAHHPPAPAFPSFRLRLHPLGAQIEWCMPRSSIWEIMKTTPLRQHAKAAFSYQPHLESIALDEDAIRFLRATCPQDSYSSKAFIEKDTEQFTTALNRLLRLPSASASILTPKGKPLPLSPDPAHWTLDGPHFPVIDSGPGGNPATDPDPAGDYTLTLRKSDDTAIPAVLAILPGHPNLVLTLEEAYPLPGPPHPGNFLSHGTTIPVAAIESPAGLSALERLRIPLPARLSRRIQTVKVSVTVRCAYQTHWSNDTFKIKATASSAGFFPDEVWKSGGWKSAGPVVNHDPAPKADTLTRLDRTLQYATHTWLSEARLGTPTWQNPVDFWMERHLVKADRTGFPDEFLAWLDQRPEGVTVELDPDLAALRDKGKVTGSFNLDLEETGIDWFDLSLNLQVSDVELTQMDIDLLLKHTGSWVRLPGRGWRKLDFEITDETQQQLADLGLSAADLKSTEKQRLHVLQLAHPAASGLLPAERTAEVQRRAADLRTAVSPDLPAGITAELRPYQLEGYHFLAYLSTNHFGGILADDMGLGKTLQALTWLAWLHESSQLDSKPILVVCPKSVQDNWTSEAAKFYPSLPVRQWTSATAGDLENLTGPPPARTPKKRGKKTDAATADAAAPPLLLIINYSQLRLNADALAAITWSTVILDEAQYIKNPTSITARTACGLTASHRLALSGTPIENRLLDLWSIMAFAMPGILGNRTAFAKNFGGKDDPHARRRLGSRVRPFLLRRTKKEVAADLPDRIEEDLICTLEGPQQDHYLAELKLARTTLLKAKTSAQLDKLRFNILTSLLRLRQICCHPRLTGKGAPHAESAKLNALLELLEPLIDEGHKVLIFSQFVEMLQLIAGELATRQWPHLILTGATEDRGALVQQFQESEGANCFLISLKAGGSGLNLTAASYVVLFDPWWNPAVENQAIDRTHRIGQVNKVIAYRLITRDTIEEKIRLLQKSKSALASDILGEETFAKALTLDDFQFLLGG